MIVTKLAVEEWKKWDPFLQDIEGFEQFLEYWFRSAGDLGINYPDYVPPCIQCLRSEKCERVYVHRVTVGGKDRLVCEFIVYRILGSAWISKEEGNGLVWTQRGNNVPIPVIERMGVNE